MFGKDPLVERSFQRPLKGSIQVTGAAKTTILAIPIPLDSAVHLEVSFVAIMSLLSNFSGANKEDNQNFTAAIGDWVQGTGGTLASAAGGQAGNGGQYTVNATPSTTLMSLVAGLDNLVAGKRYRLTFYIKRGAAWGGGDVTCTIDTDKTVVHTPTAAFVQKQLDFTADAVTPTIAFTSAASPTEADVLLIDTFELTEIAAASYVRYGTYKNAGGVVLLVGSIQGAHAQEDRTAWLAELDISGTNVNAGGTGEANATVRWLVEANRLYIKI